MGHLEAHASKQDGRYSNTSRRRDSESESEPEFSSDLEQDDKPFFKPSPSLPPPNVIRRTVGELRDLMRTPYLDINSKQHRPRPFDQNVNGLTGVIDSLMRNYHFPPIVLIQHQVRGTDGSIRYNQICIDGLKRLSAICAFMEGEIPCHDGRRRKWYYCSKNGKVETKEPDNKRYLAEDDKDDFDHKQFICHEFEELSDIQEIELRSRVHLGTTLTPGQMLRATTIYSGIQNFAERLEKDYTSIANLAQTKGLKGFYNLMKCCAQIFEIQKATIESRTPALKISEACLYEFAEVADVPTCKTIQEALDAFKILISSEEAAFSPISGKRFSTMEMIVVACLIYKYCNKGSCMVPIGSSITLLRESLHKLSRHKGILQTGENWQHAWKFILGLDLLYGIQTSALSEGSGSKEVSREGRDGLLMRHTSVGEMQEHVESRASSAIFSTTSRQNAFLKRKAPEQLLNPPAKRAHLTTLVLPSTLQSPRVSMRAASPDSVLGSDSSNDEQIPDMSDVVVQTSPVPKAEPNENKPPRELIRSSFKRVSTSVPPLITSTSSTPPASTSNSTPPPVSKWKTPLERTDSYPSTKLKSTMKSSHLSSDEPETTVPVASTSADVYIEECSATTIPRGQAYGRRGRPRKAPGGPSAKMVSNSTSQTLNMASSSVPVQRRFQESSSDSDFAPSPPPPDLAAGQGPRKRGRPRKISGDPSARTLESPAPLKLSEKQSYGKRGRPRKISGGSTARASTKSTSQPPSKMTSPSRSSQEPKPEFPSKTVATSVPLVDLSSFAMRGRPRQSSNLSTHASIDTTTGNASKSTYPAPSHEEANAEPSHETSVSIPPPHHYAIPLVGQSPVTLSNKTKVPSNGPSPVLSPKEVQTPTPRPSDDNSPWKSPVPNLPFTKSMKTPTLEDPRPLKKTTSALSSRLNSPALVSSRHNSSALPSPSPSMVQNSFTPPPKSPQLSTSRVPVSQPPILGFLRVVMFSTENA